MNMKAIMKVLLQLSDIGSETMLNNWWCSLNGAMVKCCNGEMLKLLTRVKIYFLLRLILQWLYNDRTIHRDVLIYKF